MLAKIRELIGDAWGKITTLALAFGVALDPVLGKIDPDFVKAHPVLEWAIIIVSISVAMLRFAAPPPPAIPIKRDDSVVVDHDLGIVTVGKADGTAGMTDKAAGEKA